MRKYLATISGDRYPLDFRVEASDWPTAAARAIKLWKKRWPGVKTTQLKIRLVVIEP